MVQISIRNWRACLAGALAFTAFATAPAAAQDAASGQKAKPEWYSTWGASQSWAEPGAVQDLSTRTVVQSSIAGSRAQLRISNAFGDKTLVVGRTTIALAGPQDSLKGDAVQATFGGSLSVEIPAGGSAISDPVAFAVPERTDLAISMYFPVDTGAKTVHQLGNSTSWYCPGDQTSAKVLTGGGTVGTRFWVSGVDVLSSDARGTIVAFGDSITDGQGSTNDADRRWPDYLSKRLARAGLNYGVANAGIAGNGVVINSNASFGPNGMARFDRDVLSLPNVTHVVMMIGINDIGIPNIGGEPTPAAAIISALQQIAARAQSHGIKVFGGTLGPCEGFYVGGYCTPDTEVIRQIVNTWIRKTKVFDAVIDFDKVLSDPQRPTRLRIDYDSGDHLHPNDRGYAAMANAVDLKLFKTAAK